IVLESSVSPYAFRMLKICYFSCEFCDTFRRVIQWPLTGRSVHHASKPCNHVTVYRSCPLQGALFTCSDGDCIRRSCPRGDAPSTMVCGARFVGGADRHTPAAACRDG